MLYATLRWIAGISLHWFYADIHVVGREKIPDRGPLLFAVNHHNALIDALIVSWVVPRRVWLTAKATLMDNPLVALLFGALGIVPLRRTSDERSQGGPGRNEGAFRKILDVLGEDRAVLIFPEGKSHSDPSLAPLKTGLARIALMAREHGVSDLEIVPIALNFEDKGTPASSVLVNVGQPIRVADWRGDNADMLTADVEKTLRELLTGFSPASLRDIEQGRKRGRIGGWIAAIAAAFGYWTHRFPVDAARRLAVAHSTSPDQPAMLTILYSLAILFFFYVLAATTAGYLWGFVAALIVVAGLATGAYWTAFRDHPRGY